MGGLVDRELTLASGKQKEKSCCWDLGGAAGRCMVQGIFCVPVLIFMCHVGVLLAICDKVL